VRQQGRLPPAALVSRDAVVVPYALGSCFARASKIQSTNVYREYMPLDRIFGNASKKPMSLCQKGRDVTGSYLSLLLPPFQQIVNYSLAIANQQHFSDL